MASPRVSQVLGQEVKNIEPLLPEIIRILSEGNAITRVARFLQKQGFTEEDVWREVKKLLVSSVFSSGLQSATRDFRHFDGPADGTGEWVAGLKYTQKWLKKHPGKIPGSFGEPT